MQSRVRIGLLAAAGFAATFGAAAQTGPTRIGDGLCDVRKLPPREYTECLRKAHEDSDRTMRERITAISASIDKMAGLQGPQKIRWKKALDDGQSLWVRFRNAECQDITPFETPNKGRIAEEQRICLLEYNHRRMGELKQRYPALGS
jgi:uncharacterized protein YecT (DUF1311 family)